MKWALAGLLALTLVRLVVAAVTPLAPDEAYYWVWSRVLAAGYADHPPMVALWIRAGTALGGANTFGVRLFGPLSAALGSWLLYDAAEHLFPGRRAGVTAAALLNATLILAVGAVIMTPDTPLLLFWIATLWAAARIVCGGSARWWLAAGVFSGLALVSKYTGAFLPVGLGLFALIAVPQSLRRVEPWAGALLAGLLFLPVVLWNAQHDWVSFLRQGRRVADWQPQRAVQFLGELLGGQIGLATPGVFVLLAAGLVVAIRMGLRRDPRWTLLAALSVPPILVFVQHAIGDRVEGNWPAIVYPAAAVAAAGLPGPGWRRWTWPSCGVGMVLAAALYVHAASGWPAIAARRNLVAKQLFGWNDLALRAEAVRQATGASDIIAEPYGLASELTWALSPDVEVIGVGAHWTPTTLPRTQPSGLGLLIRPVRYGPLAPAVWPDAQRLEDIVRTADGRELERYAVFLVHGGSAVKLVLPHR